MRRFAQYSTKSKTGTTKSSLKKRPAGSLNAAPAGQIKFLTFKQYKVMQTDEKGSNFHTVNPHSEHFNEFENVRLFERLQKKFTPKPYWKEYQVLRGVVLVTSFIFHLLSAATAAALVFLFIKGITQSVIIAAVLTATILAALEIAKRITSTRLFSSLMQFGKLSVGLAAAALALSALSTTAAYYGAHRAVTEWTPPAQHIDGDSITGPLRQQIAQIDKQISDTRKQTWKGKITAPAQVTIERLNRQRETALAEITRQQTRIDAKNDAAESGHKTTTEGNAAGFALFTLASEILLLLAIWYLEFYDYRSFAEHCKRPTTGGKLESIGVPLNGAQRQPIVANLRTNENRLTKIVTAPTDPRKCEFCGNGYQYGHNKQKYCCDECRISAWQSRTGKTVKKGPKNGINIT